MAYAFVHAVRAVPLQVARVFRNPLVSCVNASRLTVISGMLAKVWDNQARRLSREMRAARVAGVRALGLLLFIILVRWLMRLIA
jgi:hypothetical protein